MSEPSVREAIESALESTGSSPGAEPGSAAPAPQAPASAPPSAATPPAPGAAPAPAAAPGAAPAAPASSAAKEIEPPTKPAKVDPKQRALFEAPAKPAPAAPAGPELKAPASWKADLRERWKGIAPEVQAEIIRRERENDGRMQEAAGLRRFAEKFRDTVEPYRGVIEAEGADPLAAFTDYLKTAMLFRTGAPMQKAAMVANLVQQYGIPLQALDAYLTAQLQGRAPMPAQLPQQGMQQFPQQQAPQQFRDPRLDRLLEQHAHAQRMENKSAVESFGADPKHEFFPDVRGVMADLMDAGEKRGIELSLEDAYLRACYIVPEVKKVMDARAAAGNASQAARTLAAARHAASSLPSAGAPPAPKSNGAAPGTVREAILGAIDQLSSAA